MDQLLWIETLVKGLAGVCLVLAPSTTIRALGLPGALTSFWPRLLGSLLLAIAAASFLTGAKFLENGLGLGALAIMNLFAGAYFMGHIIFNRSEQSRRGRMLITLVAGLLLVLATTELIVR